MKLLLFAFPTLASAFVTPSSSLPIQNTPFITTTTTTPIITQYSPSSPSSLSMAGFGASNNSKKANSKKKSSGTKPAEKLKPKTQWDRYKSLKEASSVTVGMRVMYEGDEVGKWRSIGLVRSEGDEFTEMAISLQKGIIGEHAKRLHPLQFLPKDTVQWAYSPNTNTNESEIDDWTILTDKLELSPGADKKVGFEGNADPSGYYSKAGTKGYDGTNAEKKRGYNT